MGGSVISKYKAAVEKGYDIPEPSTFVFKSGLLTSRLTPQLSECHPYKALYWNSKAKELTGLKQEIRKSTGPISPSVSLWPPYTRSVKFENDDYPNSKLSEWHPYKLDFNQNIKMKKLPHELLIEGVVNVFPPYSRRVKFCREQDPSPKISECHPYRLDFDCNIRKKQVTFDNSYKRQIPTRSRCVGFEDDKNPDTTVFEKHPFLLDFGTHVMPHSHIIDKNNTFNSTYRHSGVKFSHTKVRFSDVLHEIPADIEHPKEWKPKRVHISIWECKPPTRISSPRKKFRKCIYRPQKQKITKEMSLQDSHEQLHKSVVVASHLFWTLSDMVYTDENDISQDSKRIDSLEDTNDDEEGHIFTGIDELCLYRVNELHPSVLAKHSANAAILSDGCPPVGRLNKTPHIILKRVGMCTDDHASDKVSDAIHTSDQGIKHETRRLEINSSDTIDKCVNKGAEIMKKDTDKQNTIPIDVHRLLTEIKTSKCILSTGKSPRLQQHVVITLNAVCDEHIINEYISEILGTKANFTISKVTTKVHGSSTECIADFESKGAAQRFITTLNRLSKQTGCSARFQDVPTNEKNNIEFLKKEWSLMWKEAQSPLSSHQLKIVDTSKTIQAKKKKSLSVRDVDSVLGEILALEQKLKEYNDQMQEYKDFLCTLDSEFSKIQPHVNAEGILMKLKERFNIEKERMDACLPMYGCRTKIIDMVASNQVSILLGETGSGKSTQVTQYLYEAGIANLGAVACTQPRKVAATSLAKRVAQEMHTKLGQNVGFKVGMQKNMNKDTSLIYMTDHMLLKECLEDPMLTKYSCIIIDEAHERSINTDLLLGMIKKCLPYRSDLRVIITSATINPDVFVEYFQNCPVLRVSGRVFPVDIVYSSNILSPSGDYVSAAVTKAISIAESEGPGDILVFLTTPLETEKACEKSKHLWKGNSSKLISLALHGKTQSNDQQKVFDPTPKGKRKLVFATNSAETSITIPGIKYVIDTGLVKEKQYDSAKSMSALKVTAISKSSADQRKGRAGRTSTGKCYRLYTEDDYNDMNECTLPEILRVHLGMAILELLSLSVDPLSFEFVEAPPKIALDKASEVLQYLGATEDGHLTELGKNISKLSLEPRLGKLVLRGVAEGIAYEAVLIGSFSAMGGNMFFRGGTEDNKDLADKLKVRFCHFNGDFHTMLNVYKDWEQVPEKEKNHWCMDNSINAKSMRMARDTAKEIMNTLIRDLHMKNVKQKYNDNIRFAEGIIDSLMLEMFTSNLCVFSGHERLGYIVIKDDRILHIHPSSALKSLGKLPHMLVFENTLTTSRDFMLNVTCISDETSHYFEDTSIQTCIEECKSKVVHPHVLENIGKSTMIGLIGKRFSVLKGLEKELKEALDTELLVLDASVDNGCITIYSRKDNHTQAASLLQDVIERERALLSLEEIERPLVEMSPVRAIIGHGGGIKHLLFANEFRTIMIHDIPINETAESIMELFREFGIVTDFYTNVRKEKNKSWVKIVFENPAAARNALRAIDDGYIDFELKAKPDLTGAQGLGSAKPPDMQLKLMWCRRPLKGMAFVKFDAYEPYDTEVSVAQDVVSRVQSIHLGGLRSSRISLAKKNKTELHIGNIPKDLLHQETVDRIKNTILDVCGTEPSDVFLPRENVIETTKSDVHQFKTIIETAILNESIVSEEDLRIYVPIPTQKAFEYKAFVYISNNVDIGEVQSTLSNLRIMGNTVYVKLMLKSSVLVQKEVYPYVKDEIDDLTEEMKEHFGDSIEIKGKQLRNEMYALDIQCESIEDMALLRKNISKVIEGHSIHIQDQKHLYYFKMKNGHIFLEQVQRKYYVYIQIDIYKHSLHVYGRKNDSKQAVMNIERHLKYISELEEKSFKLCDLYPAGMSKLLMSKYGLHLETIADDTLLEYADLKLRNHILLVRGKSKAIENTEKLLKIISNQLMEKSPAQKELNMPDCAVCFCPVEQGDVHRLECCGHPYCKECVKNMFHHSIRDKTFPVICAMEACGKEITVKDIFDVIGNTMLHLTPLLQGAIDKYVLAHKDTLKYCITPNCPMVYKVSKQMKIEFCNMCYVRICTRCHCQFHEGLTCETYQSMDSDDQDVLSEWLAQDKANHALCPKCGCGIEKDEGCMHMNCSMCGTHICWRCKAIFKTSAETYDHLSKQCGGIF